MKVITLFASSVLIIIFLQGCATVVQKQCVPTGGSRAHGTVKCSYEYGSGEIPKVDMQKGLKAVERRCAAWGYTGAEAFGGYTRVCINSQGRNCYRWLVTYEYQCLGTGTPPSPGEDDSSAPEE